MKTKRPFERAKLLLVPITPDFLVESAGVPEDDRGFGDIHFFD